MAIEKMTLLNLKGDVEDLDAVLLQCVASGLFHPKDVAALSEYAGAVSAYQQENPYSALLSEILGISESSSLSLGYSDFSDLDLTDQDLPDYVTKVRRAFTEYDAQRRRLEQSVTSHEETLSNLRHIAGMAVNFDELFACEHLKLRFGKLPVDSYGKLGVYEDKPFVFFVFDTDSQYKWGLYLTDEADIGRVDSIFSGLYFERIWIPEYAHGTPQDAIRRIEADLQNEREALEKLKTAYEQLVSENAEPLRKYYCEVKFLNDVYEMRRYVLLLDREFHLVGYVPSREEKKFLSLFRQTASVNIETKPARQDDRLSPPVKLRNNRFVKPFEMFVNMYGLPSYNGLDPTPLVAITYTLLFGVMFGDLGQGLVISLVGWAIWRIKRMDFGRILMRIGISSACFGVLYGSVFGLEDLLDPFYQTVFHLDSKPIHVMDGPTTNVILGTAVGAGAVIIVLSILINIFVGIKQRDWERALFSNNGVAGLVFYGSVLFAAAGMLFFNSNVLSLPFILLCVVLPLLVIFLKEPLGKLIKHHKEIFEGGIGSFLVESFFELFEVVLSFITNTMSFLRVGGFILSHAGMMAVVLTLSEMVGSAAGINIVVMIVGNVFVMAMEGLIVGIQVLRLEFYEIFSRFFDADGDAYQPVQVDYEVAR